jgi:hypothetical protein
MSDDGTRVRDQQGLSLWDLVDRIRARPNDAPLPTEYLLDDAADTIASLLEERERLKEALERSDDAISALLQWTSNWDVSFQAEDEWLRDKEVAKQVRRDIASLTSGKQGDAAS